MTFNDALEFKRQFGKDQITQDDLTMKVLVTPAHTDDFNKYMASYRSGIFSDETSKQFSSNEKFKVYGMWTDGSNVLFKDLTK